MAHVFHLVDVFGGAPLGGNPLAVVHDAADLSSDAMQQLTRWVNLSETVFLLPPTVPDADYRARIFTLGGELPFAGHPTLGACHAWLVAGGEPRRADVVVQECGVGLVPVRRRPERLAFAAPPLQRSGPLSDDERDRFAAALRIDPDTIVDAHWVDNGPGWAAVLLASQEDVLGVEPVERLGEDLFVGVVAPCPPGADGDVEVRAFFPDDRGSAIEDPVTGSLNASLAQWLLGSGRVTAPYVARQGTRLGRVGRVYVDVDDHGTIWIGGATATVVAGQSDV